jgi:hypothetical protein
MTVQPAARLYSADDLRTDRATIRFGLLPARRLA